MRKRARALLRHAVDRATSRVLGPMRLKTPSLIVLNYHRLGKASGPFEHPALGIEPDEFAAHVEWVKGRFPLVTLQDGVARLRDETLSRTSVALTFDDGHRSVADVGYELFARVGAPVTVFLCTGLLDNRDLNWLIKAWYLLQTGHGADLAGLFGQPEASVFRYIRDSRDATLADKLPELDALFLSARNGAGFPNYFMSRQDVGRAPAEVEFANHELLHARLSWLDRATQYERIAKNQRALEELCEPVPFFAVPFGTPKDWNRGTLSVCAELGLELVSCHGGVNVVGRTGPEIRRVPADRIRADRLGDVIYRNATTA